MLKYQLGSGSFAGRELIILHCQGKHLDLMIAEIEGLGRLENQLK